MPPLCLYRTLALNALSEENHEEMEEIKTVGLDYIP
jgi:hypothetical protein